tara:strand:+ start:1020 stop:1469 length:450 start_codon:yes stop_codon:yes gene_type:complete
MKKVMDKRGLSNIIVTLIMIVLVLAAVGIIWVSVQGIFDSGKEQISLNEKCLKVDISSSMICAGGVNDVCNVTMRRGAGGEDIAGVKLIFTNDAGETSFSYGVAGNIGELETRTNSSIVTTITNASVVDVVPYFISDSGAEQLCSTIRS